MMQSQGNRTNGSLGSWIDATASADAEPEFEVIQRPVVFVVGA